MQGGEEEFYQIQDDLPYTYYFTYKNKKYPINFDLFKGYSQYILRNEMEIEHDKDIPLIDEDEMKYIEIDEKTIETFVKFVHRERVGISKENVTILNYLGRKYEIERLIDVTTEYINKHRREVVVEFILTYQNNTIYDKQTYENIISTHLLEYIHDDRLLLFKFPILYRILSKYEENKLILKDQINEKEEEEIVEFYIKCLDKFGQEASILFKNVDFKYLKTDYLNLLTTKYSTVFDFHFINSSYMKTIYEEQSQTYHKLLIEEKEKEEMKREIENLKNYFHQEIDTIKKENLKHEEREEQLRKEVSALKTQIENIEQSNSDEKKINRAIFESLFYGAQSCILLQLEPEIRKKLFNELSHEFQLSLMNEFEEDTKFLFFKQLEHEKQVLFLNELSYSSKISIFNQIEKDNQLSIFSKLKKQHKFQ